MNIYIFGTKGFVDEINSLFERTNMKFRLSDDDNIVQIDSLNILKDRVKNNSNDIFLIDDEKIIKKDSLQEKLNFFKPKDRIEAEFLEKYGVGNDLSVETFDDLAKYVIKKLEQGYEQKKSNPQGRTSQALDEEQFDLVVEEIDNNTTNKGKKKVSSNEITEIDGLEESHILEALGSCANSSETTSTQAEPTQSKDESIELNSANINEVSALITQLLNNKTLEITIKIKE